MLDAWPARFFARWRDPVGEPRVVSLPCGDLSRSGTQSARAHHPWQNLHTWDAHPATRSEQLLDLPLSGPRWGPLRNNPPERSPSGPWEGQGSIFDRRAGTLGAHSGGSTGPDAALPAPPG